MSFLNCEESANWHIISLSLTSIQYLTGFNGIKTCDIIHKLLLDYSLSNQAIRTRTWEQAWINYCNKKAIAILHHKDEIESLIKNIESFSNQVKEKRSEYILGLKVLDVLTLLDSKNRIFCENYIEFCELYKDSIEIKTIALERYDKILEEKFPLNVKQSKLIFKIWKDFHDCYLLFKETLDLESEVDSQFRISERSLERYKHNLRDYLNAIWNILYYVNPNIDDVNLINFNFVD